ncbi:hypothetical protein [Vibrio penaeicida]|uniref:hypothetical protein n=1 Tax=Vibrio penaeicida TaxID=104609 RepID=UPI001CC4BCF6|nr:hypothetical protein [Vibrio penaeicida]
MINNDPQLHKAQRAYQTTADRKARYKEMSELLGSMTGFSLLALCICAVVWFSGNHEIDKDEYSTLIKNYSCETEEIYKKFFFDDGVITYAEMDQIPTIKQMKAKNFVLQNAEECSLELNPLQYMEATNVR